MDRDPELDESLDYRLLQDGDSFLDGQWSPPDQSFLLHGLGALGEDAAAEPAPTEAAPSEAGPSEAGPSKAGPSKAGLSDAAPHVSQLLSSRELDTFPTMQHFDWKKFSGLLALALLALPIYLLFTLAREHRKRPLPGQQQAQQQQQQQRGAAARRSLALVLLATLYYALLLTMVIGWRQITSAELAVALLLHACCCAVECLVRSVSVVAPRSEHLEAVPLRVHEGAALRDTTVRNVATALLQAEPQPALQRLCFAAALLCGALLALLPMALTQRASAIGVCALLVNWALCFAALSVVGKTLLQLHRRVQVAQAFRALTLCQGRSQGQSSTYLDLAQGWPAVVGWLSLRAYLLTRSRQAHTRIAAEIVLSAAFALLAPLWLLLLAQLFLVADRVQTALSFCLCASLGLFLLAAVQQAAQVQRLYRDRLPLKSAQLRALSRETLRVDATAEPLFREALPSDRFVRQLKTLDALLEHQDEGILFCVLGLPLNERAVAAMLTFLASVLSSGLSRLLAQ